MFNVFAGECPERIQMHRENTLKAFYSKCVRHLSVGDVATLRGRLKQPVRGTVKKDSDAHLQRYFSIQSLPTNATQYSTALQSSCNGSALKPQTRTADEAIYATPMQAEFLEDLKDTPPPLPPPPLEFRSAVSGSEVIPIVTKLDHTYANVSESVKTMSDSAVESSFRPGENACLSSGVSSNSHQTCAADASAVKPVPVAVGDSNNEDTVSESVDVECWSTSSHHSAHSSASSSSLSSRGSLSLPGHHLTSASSPSHSCTSRFHPLLSSVDGIGLKKNQTHLPSGGVKQASGLGVCLQEQPKNCNGSVIDVRHEAISVHHNSVQKADVEVDGDRMQCNQPTHRLLHRAVQTKQGMNTMVAPLKVVREHSQLARVTKRSFSVDAASQDHVGADNNRTASVDDETAALEDADCGFLFLAERARQEYIQRRVSVVGCEEHRLGKSVIERHKSTLQPVAVVSQRNLRDSGGEFKQMIAQKAVELQRNRAAAANDELVANHCRKETGPLANGSHGTVTNAALREQHGKPQFINSKLNQKEYSLETLQKSCDRENTTVSNSAAVFGRTSVSSDISELAPVSGELVVLPPPPDFAGCNGQNPLNTERVSSACELSVDQLALDMVLPPPPPEFSDGTNHVTSDLGCHRPVTTWSVNDVTRWLDSLQMSDHCDMFVAHSVDGRKLMQLGRSELIALGVSQVGQRMNLERAIKRAVISMPSSL